MADTYQRLAAIRPANTSENELYEVPASTEILGYINWCNQTSATVDISVAHTDTSGAAAVEDWLYYGSPLAANASNGIQVMMGEGETIRVATSAADSVSFVISGLKVT